MPQLQLEERFISAVQGTERAANIADVTALARAVLAPQSFDLGVCYGIAENVGGMARAFLSLTKIFVLAGLYDATRLPTWSVGSLMPLYLEGKAVEWLVGPGPLKAAHDTRNTLIRELGTAVMHPADLLGSAAKNIAQDYTSKWNRFRQIMRQTSLSATFEAGRISGEILVDVLMLIGTAAEIAKATKFLAEIPELVRLSKSIGSASGRGFAEEGNAAARFSESFKEGSRGTRPSAAPKEILDAIPPDAKRIPGMQFEGGAKDGGAAGRLLGAGVESGLGALAARGAIAAGGEAAAAENAAKPFGMGLEAELDTFAQARGATTWKQLPNTENWRSSVLDKLADPNTPVHFNLNGVDVWSGVQRAASGTGGATDWELLQIRQNPQFWNSTTFWKNGQVAPNPFK